MYTILDVRHTLLKLGGGPSPGRCWFPTKVAVVAHLEEAGMIRIMEISRAKGARGRAKRI